MRKIILIIFLLLIMVNVVNSETIEYEPEVKVIELHLSSFRDIINMNYRYNLKEGDAWGCDEGVRYMKYSNALVNYRSDIKTCIIISG